MIFAGQQSAQELVKLLVLFFIVTQFAWSTSLKAEICSTICLFEKYVFQRFDKIHNFGKRLMICL